MRDQLKMSVSSAHRQHAANIGQLEISIEDKVLKLFQELPDLLLDADDVYSLLGNTTEYRIQQCQDALIAHVQAGMLESDDRTKRPFDEDETTLYRLKRAHRSRLKILGEEIQVSPTSSRLQFSCDGRVIRSVAYVARLDALASEGNQRDEIPKHVATIAKGISSGVAVPNSIILVLRASMVTVAPDENEEPPEGHIVVRPLQDDWITVRHPTNENAVVQIWRPVEIDFPYRDAAFDSEKSAQIVDGQQRTAALSLVSVDAFPVVPLSVNAMVATDDEARKIFQVANNSVKITTDFNRALIATTDDPQGFYADEINVAKAVKSLVLHDIESPFYGKVKHPGVQYDRGASPAIAYNSLFSLVKEMLLGPISLIVKTPEDIAYLVSQSFSRVKDKYPSEWGRNPKQSKLMHGAGLRSVADVITREIESVIQENEDIETVQDSRIWERVTSIVNTMSQRVVWSADALSAAAEDVRDFYVASIAAVQNTPKDILKLKQALKVRLSETIGRRRPRRS